MLPPISTVHDFPSGKMTDAAYESERERLRELYGDNSIEAAARRDQALAILFIRSGWNQDRLAEKEGTDQGHIARRLLFGRFLGFMPTGINLKNVPNNLTERRFRGYWLQTDRAEKNERIRFRAVQALMAEDIALKKQKRPQIGKALVAEFGDGKWHPLIKIAEHLNVEVDHAEATLTSMRSGAYGAKSESKQVGKGLHYRIFKTDKTVNSTELTEKLAPIIKKLLVEGKKNAATASPAAVLFLAGTLQQLLDEWTE